MGMFKKKTDSLIQKFFTKGKLDINKGMAKYKIEILANAHMTSISFALRSL
jgi:hypothetical protein